MATFTNAAKLAQHQRDRARRLQHGPTSIESAAKAGAEIAMKEAAALSSGPHRTPKELHKAGHPFARASRLGRVGQVFRAAPLLPIGQMSGDLVRKWRIFSRSAAGGGIYRMQSLSPHARYVLAPGGTARMADRGFWRELNRRTLAKIRRAKLELHRAALKG